MLGVGGDMLSDMEIFGMVITLAFVAGVVYSVDVLVDLLTDALTVLITDVVSAVDAVDMLADENVNRLAAMTPPSEFTLPAP